MKKIFNEFGNNIIICIVILIVICIIGTTSVDNFGNSYGSGLLGNFGKQLNKSIESFQYDSILNKNLFSLDDVKATAATHDGIVSNNYTTCEISKKNNKIYISNINLNATSVLYVGEYDQGIYRIRYDLKEGKNYKNIRRLILPDINRIDNIGNYNEYYKENTGNPYFVDFSGDSYIFNLNKKSKIYIAFPSYYVQELKVKEEVISNMSIKKIN